MFFDGGAVILQPLFASFVATRRCCVSLPVISSEMESALVDEIFFLKVNKLQLFVHENKIFLKDTLMEILLQTSAVSKDRLLY